MQVTPATRQFRPRGFAPPRRLKPSACCESISPHSQTGFAAFPMTCDPHPKMLAPTGPFPNSAFTLRRVPLTSSRAASLRPLPPRRSPPCTPLDDLTALVAFAALGSGCVIRSEDLVSTSRTSTLASSLKQARCGPSSGWTVTPSRMVCLPRRTLHTCRFEPPSPFSADGPQAALPGSSPKR